MQILDFDSRIFLAPMAGITDKPMRKIVSSFGKGIMVSEMVAINALSRKNEKTYRIADVRDENYPVVVQLVGGDDVGVVIVHDHVGADLLEVVHAAGGARLLPRLVQRRQQHGGKNGDDRDDHQKFDEGEVPTSHKTNSLLLLTGFAYGFFPVPSHRSLK